MWDYWLMEEKDGMEHFTPIEFNEDGSLKAIVTGMLLVSSLDAMKECAKAIWRVNDLEDCEAALKVWDAAEERGET